VQDVRKMPSNTRRASGSFTGNKVWLAVESLPQRAGSPRLCRPRIDSAGVRSVTGHWHQFYNARGNRAHGPELNTHG
jgi:hypothetical protein